MLTKEQKVYAKTEQAHSLFSTDTFTYTSTYTYTTMPELSTQTYAFTVSETSLEDLARDLENHNNWIELLRATQNWDCRTDSEVDFKMKVGKLVSNVLEDKNKLRLEINELKRIVEAKDEELAKYQQCTCNLKPSK